MDKTTVYQHRRFLDLKEGQHYLMPTRQIAVCVWAGEEKSAFKYQNGDEVSLSNHFCRRNLQPWTITTE